MSVQIKTKDLSNAKQIALALRQFAIDNNGSYPAKQPGYSSAPATPPLNTNAADWWHFPNYLQHEAISAISVEAFYPGNSQSLTHPAHRRA